MVVHVVTLVAKHRPNMTGIITCSNSLVVSELSEHQGAPDKAPDLRSDFTDFTTEHYE